MNGEDPTVGERRGSTIYLSGGGFRASIFHLGALTRLNELGLLAGTETINAVAGGSIVAALLAFRVPWPLLGAFRDWPEAVAEPLREIARTRVRPWALSRGPSGGGEAALEERYARELVRSDGEREGRPRLVIGAAGIALGGLESGEREGSPTSLRWELNRPSGPPGYDPELIVEALGAIAEDLNPLTDAAQGLLENHGYLLVDRALRDTDGRVAAIEPLPPEPPHPAWMNGSRVRGSLLAARRPRLGSMRPGWTRRGGGRSGSDIDALLEHHRPVIQYDSLESFRADSVATIAEMAIEGRGNALHRGDGTAIASVLPVDGLARLHLGYLGRYTYADGQAVERSDYIDEAGGSHAGDAQAVRRQPGCADVVYGHALEAGGRLWLQYWLFFYFNDKGFLNAGRHEGDWEMIQVRIGDREEPDAVSYAQHAGGERAAWAEVERERADGSAAPIVYCARGSHAPRLRPGTHAAPGVPDHNDGLGPRLRPRLVKIGPNGPDWAHWPGRWGSTRRREAFEGNSPRGPVEHSQWHDPEIFHREARPFLEAPRWEEPPPPTPRYGAHLDGDAAVLSYRLPGQRGGRAAPARIVAAPFSADAADVVVSHSFLIDRPAGSCVMPAPADAPLHGIRVSVSSEVGTPGETVTVPVES